jgi:cation diffusion facilitator CzcD-associated flavoprotein CzcO
VGAGSSGLAAARWFRAGGILFDCLEREDDVGGNWYYGKAHSSVYRSVRLISSKRETEYGDFPMPAEWPEHPGHELVWQYLRDYARHFDLYRSIQFDTAVQRIEPAWGAGIAGQGASSRDGGGWDITLANGVRRRYRGMVIANGHNWDPRWPAYPGQFCGEVLHSSQYTTPERCTGRRVLVVGGGNSGFDIAVDVSAHASATLHSLRRGYHVLPRYLHGVPIDRCGLWMLRWRLPIWVRRLAAQRALRLAWGKQLLQSLPRPDHRLFETHPVINSRWPHVVSSGRIRVKPDVRQLEGEHVVFADGSRERVDIIIYATGYKLSFPFLDRGYLNWRADGPELYLNIFHPERDDLFVIGMIQPNSGQFGLVDCQARLVADYIRGIERKKPAALRFQEEKQRATIAACNGGIRYVRSPRHLIEVEHASYRRQLKRLIRRLQ